MSKILKYVFLFSGITSKVYKWRAEILVQYAKNEDLTMQGDLTMVNCATPAAELCSKLLRETPFAVEIVRCLTCTTTKSLPLTTFSINIDWINSDLENKVVEGLHNTEIVCSICNDNATLQNEILGKILFII